MLTCFSSPHTHTLTPSHPHSLTVCRLALTSLPHGSPSLPSCPITQSPSHSSLSGLTKGGLSHASPSQSKRRKKTGSRFSVSNTVKYGCCTLTHVAVCSVTAFSHEPHFFPSPLSLPPSFSSFLQSLSFSLSLSPSPDPHPYSLSSLSLPLPFSPSLPIPIPSLFPLETRLL